MKKVILGGLFIVFLVINLLPSALKEEPQKEFDLTQLEQ